MKNVASAWVLPDAAQIRAARADSEVRVLEFVLFALIPLRTVPLADLPLNELASLAIVAFAALRPATARHRFTQPVMWLCALLLALVLLSGVVNDVDWTRRVGHVAIWCGLVWACSTGRVSLRSAALGLGTGLIAVISLYFVGIGGDTYVGRLTGFLGDPNAGAYFIITLGILAVGFADERVRVRLLFAIPLIAGLVLTYSRTGLLALAFALLWWLVGRRLGVLGGAAVVVALIWVVDNIPEDLTLFGPFSERSGSDALRDRIIAKETVLLDQAPWYGSGPGTAKVTLGEQEFFFHNSYLAVRQEGGWLLLTLLLSMAALAFVAVSRRARTGDGPAIAAQAAIIASLVMGVTLGEVLLDLPLALAIGFALSRASARTSLDEPSIVGNIVETPRSDPE